MKVIKIVTLILLLIPSISFAGEIYGTITDNNGKPFAHQKVTITSQDNQVFEATTDDNGYFTVNVTATDKCILTTGGCSIEVYSNDSPNGYTLNITNPNTNQCLIKK